MGFFETIKPSLTEFEGTKTTISSSGARDYEKREIFNQLPAKTIFYELI